MTIQRKNLIKSIETILQQISIQIPKYENSVQRILYDFLNPFRLIADKNKFKEKLKEFDSKYRFSKDYYKLAFLWQACDFVILVYRQLILDKEPLGFIISTLRSIHSLVRDQVPLARIPEWEFLQYSYQKSLIPLLHEKYGDELQILKRLISLISEKGLGSLNHKHIFNAVRPSISGPPWKPKIEEQVSTFFDLSRIEWDLHFYPAAFSLSRVFVYLIVNEPQKAEEIQSAFSRPDAQISQASRAFIGLEGEKESFVGLVVIPCGYFNSFRNFLEQWEEQEILRIVECQEVVNFKYSISYVHYQAGIGWSFQTKKFKDIKDRKRPFIKIESPLADQIIATHQWNSNWSYANSPNSQRLVETLWKYWLSFSYENLRKLSPNIRRDQDHSKLFEPYTDLLWELFNNNVLQVTITPRGFLRSYSINDYVVFIPRTVSQENLIKFLSILPFSLSFELRNGQIRLFCFLDPVLAKFISQSLGWKVIPLKSIGRAILHQNYYDFKAHTWKKPWFLLEDPVNRLEF